MNMVGEMGNTNILGIVKEKIWSFFYLMKEGYKLKDKMIILRYYLKSPMHFLNYLFGRKNSRNLDGNVFIKNRYGLFFCGDNFSGVFGAGSFCEPEVRREFVLKEGVAIDVGANLGMLSIPLAKMLGDKGKVISIEAEKKNIEFLRKNVRINNLKNVFVIGKGAYSKKGKINLNLDEYGIGGHSIQKTKGSEFGKKQLIDVDTIDNILKELKIKKVDLVKIDIEGGEIDALKGAKKTLKKCHPKIIFEAVEDVEKGKIELMLAKYGYKIKPLKDVNYVAE